MLAYLAGFIDADGFIGLHRKKSPTRTYYTPRVGISGTQRDPLDLAAETFGGRVRSYDPRVAGHRGVFVWERSGRYAVQVLDALRPYLRVKAEHVLLIDAFLEDRELENALINSEFGVGVLSLTGRYDVEVVREADFDGLASIQLRRRRGEGDGATS